jgi:hypothetical protein
MNAHDPMTRRRAITAALGGAAAIAIAGRARAAPFGSEQRAAAERIVRREVDAGNAPGITWSIGNTQETLAEGAVGLRIVSPAVPMDAATRFALACSCCATRGSSRSTRRSPPTCRPIAMPTR